MLGWVHRRAPGLLGSEVFRFLVAGGTAAVANLGSGVLIRLIPAPHEPASGLALIFSHIQYELSVYTGYAVGTVVSFYLNRKFTFSATTERVGGQMVRFAISAVGGAVLGAVVARVLLLLFRWAVGQWFADKLLESAGHAGAIAITTVYNYAAMKYFAFRKSPERSAGAASSS